MTRVKQKSLGLPQYWGHPMKVFRDFKIGVGMIAGFVFVALGCGVVGSIAMTQDESTC